MNNIFKVFALGIAVSSFAAFANPSAPGSTTDKAQTEVKKEEKAADKAATEHAAHEASKKISHKEASRMCIEKDASLKDNKAGLKTCIKEMRHSS